MEGTHDNETEPLTFSKIGLQAALILNRLRVTTQLLELAKQGEEKDERESKPCNGDENKCTDNRENIERRLRELSEWENRIAEDRKRLRR